MCRKSFHSESTAHSLCYIKLVEISRLLTWCCIKNRLQCTCISRLSILSSTNDFIIASEIFKIFWIIEDWVLWLLWINNSTIKHDTTEQKIQNQVDIVTIRSVKITLMFHRKLPFFCNVFKYHIIRFIKTTFGPNKLKWGCLLDSNLVYFQPKLTIWSASTIQNHCRTNLALGGSGVNLSPMLDRSNTVHMHRHVTWMNASRPV